MLKWLKHAFAINTAQVIIPTPSQAKSIDFVCREVIRRQMVLPAQMLLESSIPIHYFSGQLLRFFEPILSSMLDPAMVRDVATFVEQRGAFEYVCRRLGELQNDSSHYAAASSISKPNEEVDI